MKIEIVEFYPTELKGKKTYQGTLHIYLIDHEIDIRGIAVFKDKKKWFFQLPRKWEIDKDSGEKVFFPIFSFTSTQKNQEILDFLHKNAIKYIQENFLRKK